MFLPSAFAWLSSRLCIIASRPYKVAWVPKIQVNWLSQATFQDISSNILPSFVRARDRPRVTVAWLSEPIERQKTVQTTLSEFCFSGLATAYSETHAASAVGADHVRIKREYATYLSRNWT